MQKIVKILRFSMGLIMVIIKRRQQSKIQESAAHLERR